jgi:hypothetical protein
MGFATERVRRALREREIPDLASVKAAPNYVGTSSFKSDQQRFVALFANMAGIAPSAIRPQANDIWARACSRPPSRGRTRSRSTSPATSRAQSPGGLKAGGGGGEGVPDDGVGGGVEEKITSASSAVRYIAAKIKRDVYTAEELVSRRMKARGGGRRGATAPHGGRDLLVM